MKHQERIVVTGSLGFIGSAFLDSLPTGVEVLSLDRQSPRLKRQKSDQIRHHICDYSQLTADDRARIQDFLPTSWLHAGWTGLPDYSLKTCLENTKSTLEFLQFLLTIGVKKHLILGSCWEYGDAKGLCTEDHPPLSPINLFASNKWGLFHMANSLCESAQAHLIWPIVFFVYGKGQRPNSLIPMLLESFKNDKPIVLRTPYAVSDFIYIKDVATALWAFVNTQNISGRFNISTGVGTRAHEVQELVSKLYAKSTIDSTMTSESQSVQGFWGDNSKVKKVTSWAPQYSLEAGIRDMLSPNI